ncbi:unnamed protein product [Toxocara canis]|uniref:Cytochrome b5 n=1 Tax=Toxocara canis TaxID=6265 RepID=A0A3P7IC41_TOXCA|nr:unnamed protein product [Toxocara canis]
MGNRVEEGEMASLKKVTRAEVAEHNNNRSTWIVMSNKVYDVTKFLDEHPGGCEVLLEQAGVDGTEAYEDVGHSTDAREMREGYLVAEIVDDEKQTYSYDKKTWDTKATEKPGESQSLMDILTYPALIAVIIALVYYLLFA